jgi:epsilon-lactone hydrolase
MTCRGSLPLSVLFTVAFFVQLVHAQEATSQVTDRRVSSYIDENGTAYIKRVVEVPQTISAEAQKSLIAQHIPATPETRKLLLRQMFETTRTAYPANVELSTIGGVPVSVVTPLVIPPSKKDRVLINLHGGGFTSDSGSLTESMPLANLTETKVVSVMYRLAPEHTFPAPVEDVVSVYKELLKPYAAHHIAIYGSSAGAVLTPEVAVELKQLGLPLPGALGIFSGGGDFTRDGDSQQVYGSRGLVGDPDTRPKGVQWLAVYVGSADPKNPVLSPIFADLHGMPATLFVTSTRDMLLSQTSTLHRAFLRAGVDAELVVFDGLNHCFWYDPALPESREADQIIADFFNKHLSAR